MDTSTGRQVLGGIGLARGHHTSITVTHLNADLKHRMRPKVIITLYFLFIILSDLASPGHEQLLHILLRMVHLLIPPGACAEALHEGTEAKGTLRRTWRSKLRRRALQGVKRAQMSGS